MFLSAYLAILCSQLPVDVRAGENQLTVLEIKNGTNGVSFAWQDADESVRGAISPSPKAGRTLTISAAVEPLAGAPFEGPVTFSLRPLGAMESADSVTVTKKPGEKAWVATFTPTEAVDHRLEISWRSTHHKVVRGVVPVLQAGLPLWVNWAVGGGMVALAVAIGLWVLFRSKESSP
jgi:hypothetical protein